MDKQQTSANFDKLSDPEMDSAASPDIIATIKNEHKYTLLLVDIIKEQMAEFDIGKKPDYLLILDTLNFLIGFREKFNHPAKEKLIRYIIDIDPINSVDLENLLAEKKQVQNSFKEVKAAVKSLLKEQTMLREEQLKIFSKDCIELMQSHVDLESQVLITKARSMLSDETLQGLSKGVSHDDEQDFSRLLEGGYKELSKALNQRWEDIEDAANDLALAEFVGMGALFEAIEPLTLNMAEMSKVIKQLSYKLYTNNYECYKKLIDYK